MIVKLFILGSLETIDSISADSLMSEIYGVLKRYELVPKLTYQCQNCHRLELSRAEEFEVCDL